MPSMFLDHYQHSSFDNYYFYWSDAEPSPEDVGGMAFRRVS